jgi:hypothetical protein
MHWVFESGSSHRNATITVDGARHTENKIFTRSSTVFHSGTANWTRRPDTYWKRNKFRVVFCLFIARVMRLRRFRGCCDGSGWVGVEGAVQKKITSLFLGTHENLKLRLGSSSRSLMWRGIKIVDAAQVYAQLPNFLAGVINKGNYLLFRQRS